MANKHGSNREFFQYIYDNNEKAPWDIGRVQSALQYYIIFRGPKKGRCLEVGCGTGDLSIYLAKRSLEVIGIDYIQKPIDVAKAKAIAENIDVKFEVRDAFGLGYDANMFDYIFDGGFLHNLTDEYIEKFERIAFKLLKPDGQYIVCGVSHSQGYPGPREINDVVLHKYFGNRWIIQETYEVSFENHLNGPEEVPGVLAVVQKNGV
jgi:2-polyprenyl-3-methyl-5-hydroxy-6-metoxy-1,4-benzoquinol methylase